MIIAVEGIDQAGKHTQSSMLRRALEEEGKKVRLFSFPDYSTASGAEIRKQLAGREKFQGEKLHRLQAENRAEKLGQIMDLLPHTILVMDRYTPSNMAYGLANGLNRPLLEEIDAKMPKPDLVILIDIDEQTSLKRKGTGRDRFESDLKFAGKVRRNYMDLARDGSWSKVDGSGKPEAVHGEIMRAVRKAVAQKTAS